MRIRCERCATVYELDEARLPPQGALVKCTRCDHVFRAAPPAKVETPAPVPGGTPAGSGVAAPPVPTAERTAVFDFGRAVTPEHTESFPGAPPAAVAPAPGSPRTVERAHAASRPRASAVAEPPVRRPLWPWVLVALAIVVALVVAWLATRRRPDAVAAGRLGAIEALLARDDHGSLARAAERASAEPGGDAAALRALALLWLAADAGAEVRPARERVAGLEALERLEERERSPGWRARRDAIVERRRNAEADARELASREARFLAEASAAEQAARVSGASGIGLLRAEAVRQALLGDPELARTVRAAAAVDASDPWVELARHLAPGAPAEGDVAALRALVARYPGVLRAQVALARTLHAAGREGDALQAVDAVLAENADHEVAKGVKAAMLAPPPAAVSRVEVGAGPPPVRPGGYLPRLRPRS